MNMEFQMILEQKQILSQKQLQSLKILAMDAVELHDVMQKEYLENPMLEYHSQGDACFRPELFYPSGGENKGNEEEPEIKEIMQEDRYQIQKYVCHQLNREKYTDQEWKLIQYMICSLDDNGYFVESPEDTAKITRVPEEDVRKCLADLRQIEPVGIFSSGLKECLIQQVQMMDEDMEDVCKIIEEHLADVAAGRIQNITRHLHISTACARQCIRVIKSLNPRPLAGLSGEKASYVVPDIVVRREKTGWEVELNDKWIGDYSINDYYLRMIAVTKDEKLAEYFREKLNRAKFMIEAVESRRRTITAVVQAVMKWQEAYFLGMGSPRPMAMNDIADEIGVHISTVSRAVKGKYLQYPGGCLPLKQLFTKSAVKQETGNGIGVTAGEIKGMIRRIIGEENKEKPYSDQKIYQLLRDQQISISRRVIAKYREEMNIPGSFQRRMYGA